jgi:hypothetical protein
MDTSYFTRRRFKLDTYEFSCRTRIEKAALTLDGTPATSLPFAVLSNAKCCGGFSFSACWLASPCTIYGNRHVKGGRRAVSGCHVHGCLLAPVRSRCWSLLGSPRSSAASVTSMPARPDLAACSSIPAATMHMPSKDTLDAAPACMRP